MPRWERSRSLARTDSTLRSVMGGLSGGGDEGAYFSGQGLCRLNVRLAAACNRLTSRQSRSSPRTLRASRHQIGRASRRERVCQYVETSVVAAYLKKKNKEKV